MNTVWNLFSYPIGVLSLHRGVFRGSSKPATSLVSHKNARFFPFFHKPGGCHRLVVVGLEEGGVVDLTGQDRRGLVTERSPPGLQEI